MCHKGKFNKERITMIFCVNMSGTEKITLFIMAKAKQPNCFKNVCSPPANYDFNKA